MGVLLCLARHPGETLSKDELFQAVWPKTVVTEDVLKRCIAELRRAFNDDAREPHVIETISKRGYRLLAPVSKETAATRAKATVSDSIAVLPFVNMSADPENEYFADGITEEIIDALAQISELRVVARSSAFSFKGKNIDLRIVGEQLSVRTVLEGSVRRADNRLRITAQLVNAADGYHLWSERYDREMKDVFAIQEEIAQSIAQRLKITFPWEQQKPLIRVGTPNLEAYQSYVKGRALLHKRGTALWRALACCQRAVDLDPNYALAWAGVADCHTLLGIYWLAPPHATMPKATEAARRAVELDSSLAEGHSALALASLLDGWDTAEAGREFVRAIELNPQDVVTRDSYAYFYLQLSERRLMEGMQQAKFALALDPHSGYAHAMYALTCLAPGKIPEGVDAARRAVELDPESFLAHWVLEVALSKSGQFEAAVAIAELALVMSGRHAIAMTMLAVTLADWGRPDEADAVYREVQARAHRDCVSPAFLALLACAAGREEEAIRHARRAFDVRDPNCQLAFSRCSNYGARLYRYPGFREIIAQMGRSEWLCDPPPEWSARK